MKRYIIPPSKPKSPFVRLALKRQAGRHEKGSVKSLREKAKAFLEKMDRGGFAYFSGHGEVRKPATQFGLHQAFHTSR